MDVPAPCGYRALGRCALRAVPARNAGPGPVVVLGGGAAGLMAAMTAGRRGRRVVVLEKNDELGKKIRISGGGRCNFTNISDGFKVGYHSTPLKDCSDGSFFQKAFRRYPPEKFIALVESHGIKYHEKKLGQLFCNKSARQIVEMLQQECEAAKVSFETGAECLDVKKAESDHFTVKYQQGEMVHEMPAEAVVVATGGLSYARTCGSTDLAHRIAESFKLTVTGVRPGLVPLLGGDAWTRSLTGVSLEVAASIGKVRFEERILFTHKGISGPAVLQASSYWDQQHATSLSLDLLPHMDEAAVVAWLQRRASSALQRGRKTLASEELARKLPRRFAEGFWANEVCGRLGVRRSSGLAEVKATELPRLAALLKAWELKLTGTEGYLKAEVTCGGVSTKELSEETMASKKCPGLYFVGEAVDVTGWLGGYNFQWAWASGHSAGSVC